MRIVKNEGSIYICFENGSVYVPHKKKMLEDTDNQTISQFFNLKNIPKATFHKFLNSELISVRSALAEHGNALPIDIIEKLAKDESDRVREVTALRRNLPIEIIEDLADDNNRFVKQCVILNRETPDRIIKKLAKDEDWQVRGGVARNSSVPEILVQLAKDEVWQVRCFVAENPDTPYGVIKALKKDANKCVREAIEKIENFQA